MLFEGSLATSESVVTNDFFARMSIKSSFGLMNCSLKMAGLFWVVAKFLLTELLVSEFLLSEFWIFSVVVFTVSRISLKRLL